PAPSVAPPAAPAAAPVAPVETIPPPAPGPTPPPNDWTASLLQFLPAIKACVFERMRAEAVLFAAGQPGHDVHVLLRLQEGRYADCTVTPLGGMPRFKKRSQGTRLAREEQLALLTLLPGQPPRGPCDRTEPALDVNGNPFGWITRKGC